MSRMGLFTSKMDCEENSGAPLRNVVDSEVISKTEHSELAADCKITIQKEICLNSGNLHQEFSEKNPSISISNSGNDKEQSSNEDVNRIINGEITPPVTDGELYTSNICEENQPETSLLEQPVSADVINSIETTSVSAVCVNIDKCGVDKNSHSEILDKDNSTVDIISKNKEESNISVDFCSDEEIEKKQSNDLNISDPIVIEKGNVSKPKDTNDSSTCGSKTEQDLNNCVVERHILEFGNSQPTINECITNSSSDLDHSIDDIFVKESICSIDEHNNSCDNLKEENVIDGNECVRNNVNCDNNAHEKKATDVQTKKATIVESVLDEVSIGSDDIDIDGFKFEENETDDEIDSILPEFVDSEYTNKDNSEDKSDLNIILSDSEAEMDSVIEAFKVDDSEDDCLIIEDDCKEILLNDDKTVDNELPPAKRMKVTNSQMDPKLSSKEKGTIRPSGALTSNTKIEKTIKIKTNDVIIHHKIKETPTGIYLQSNTCAIIEEKKGNNSLFTNSEDTAVNNQVSNDVGDEDSDCVLDLINENIDSIVSLISDSSPEKTQEKSVKDNDSDHNNSCKIESNSEMKNKEDSDRVHDNLILSELKKILSNLIDKIDQLNSSECLNGAACESQNIDISKSINLELLNDSSDSDFSLNLPMQVSASSAELEESIDIKDVKVILEELPTQLKNDTIASNEIKNEVDLLTDKLLKVEDIKTETKLAPEQISIELPPVPLQSAISGVFTFCNGVDKKECVVKEEALNADHESQEPVIDVHSSEEEKKSVKLEINAAKIEPALLTNGDSNNSEKKRRLEDDEISNEKKKFKEEKFENTDSFIQDSLGYNKVQEIVSDFLQHRVVDKFETNSDWLMKIAHMMCCKTVHDMYLDDMEDMCDLVQTLEKSIKSVTEKMENYRNIAGKLCSTQNKAFDDLNFNPKVQTRTVGVNVKIFRECDLRSSGYHTSSNSAPPPSSFKVIPSEKAMSLLSALPKTTAESLLKTSSVLKSIQSLPQTSSKTSLQMQQSALVSPVARAISNINTPRTVLSSPTQRFTSPPNVTVAKSGMFTSSSPSNVVSHNAPGQPQKKSNQLIDLTDDESTAINKAVAGTSTNVAPTAATVSKVSLPSTVQRNNVLVPFGNVLQMLPSVQNRPLNSQITRQIVPPIPSNLIGQRTLGYIVTGNTNNSVNTNTFGGRGGISVPTFLSNQNQRMQTFVVRMTNPSVTTPLGTLVNNTPRMPAVPQTSNATTTLPSSSGLVLFPHTPSHPAPFPQMPSYPYNPKLKSLPPKPSLKGTRADSGIILSWNIHVFNPTHADITSYQLFAYQETAAPVSSALWKNVGNINALPLPMACTLTQFIEGHRYYFTVRAVDCHGRFGPFSTPVSILYSRNAT